MDIDLDKTLYFLSKRIHHYCRNWYNEGFECEQLRVDLIDYDTHPENWLTLTEWEDITLLSKQEIEKKLNGYDSAITWEREYAKKYPSRNEELTLQNMIEHQQYLRGVLEGFSRTVNKT